MSQQRKRRPAQQRFWEKVQKSDACWEWTAALMGSIGYGNFWLEGRPVLAHRFSYELAYGRIPDGMQVLHKCDNPKCVRPEHLFLGTQADNMRDKVKKSRQWRPRGEQANGSKLTWKDAAEIRARYAAGGISQTKLAEEYGTHQTNISKIILGKSWLASPE